MDTTHHVDVHGDAPPPPLAKLANNYVSTQPQEYTMSVFIPAGQSEAVVVISFMEQKIVPIIDGTVHGVRGEKEVTATVLLNKQMFQEMFRLGNSILDQVTEIERAKADGQRKHKT